MQPIIKINATFNNKYILLDKIIATNNNDLT